MPGFLVHQNATVMCAHGGTALPTATVPNVLVMGQPVVIQPGPWQIAGCALPPPIVANGPCVTAMFTTAAVRVTCFGAPLLLQDSQAICAPSGTPLLIVTTQTRVFGT